MGHAKTVTERLQTLLKYSGQHKVQAVAMMGLGYPSTDISQATGMSLESVHVLRQGNAATIKAVRNAPDEARAYLVQAQKDAAILRGFALSHDPTLDSRNLGNVARSAVTLSRDLAKTAPPKPHIQEPPPPPSRPQ